MQDVLVYVSIDFEWLPWNCKRSCPVHTSLEKFENTTITSHFGIVFEEIVTSLFWKSCILKLFSVHIKTQSQRFQIPRV